MSDMAAPIIEDMRIRPFSVAEYHLMGDANIFGPEERVELLDGHLIEMAPIGIEHANAVTRLNRLLLLRFDGRATVRPQLPVTLDGRSEPQPDLVLVRPQHDDSAHPTPADALLVVEVSDSTLAFDRGDKLAAYARSGVPEYWIVNLIDQVIEQHADPAGAIYRTNRVYRNGERIAPLAFPNDFIDMTTLLG